MKGFIVLLLLSFISVVSGQHSQNYSQYRSSDDNFIKDNINEQSEKSIPGWERLYPLPTDGFIADFIVQGNLVMFVSIPEYPEEEEFSEIYKSTDYSNTWIKMPAPRRTYFSSIKISEDVIYISGLEKNGSISEGVVYRSDDSGESWEKCLQFGNQSFEEIFLFSPDDITVFSFKSNDTLHILHSSDGGIAWDISSCKIPLQLVEHVKFLDRQTGWMAGLGTSHYILRTRNGGISWDTISQFTRHSVEALSMIDSLNGFMVRSEYEDKIYKTTDGGVSWDLKYSLGILKQTQVLAAVDSQNIYFLHSYGGENKRRLYKSSDGGNSWSYNLIDFYEPVGRLWFATPAEGWISGYRGIFRKSVDGGITWENQTKTLTDITQMEISFCDTQNGWIISKNGYLLYSTDGGSRWEVKLKDSIYTFFDVLLLNESTGFIISNYTYYYRGRISRTTDGGNSWYSTNLNSLLLFKIFFADSLNGWVIGEHDYVHSINYPYILKTTDGGLNWSRQTNIDFHTTLYRLPTKGIHFTDANNGWCVGTYGTILRTTDGGDSWLTRRGGLGDSLFWKNYDMCDVFFIDHNRGYIAGMYNYNQLLILRTFDSGESWDTLSLDGYGEYELFFQDENTGFLLGGMNGKSYSTTDGGKSWNLINEIKYVNGSCTYSNYIWTVGPAGRLYRYTGTPLTADEPNFFAAGYYLEQNYPNPFNPSTKIRFSVDRKQKIVLKVFDSIGRHIDTLFDKEAEKGMYEVVFDKQTLASGVYFYVLFAAENKAAKKMIILK